jgi:hypothetical protein
MSAISEVLDALRVCSDAFEHKPTKKLAPTIVSHDHIVIDELVAKRFRGLSIAVSTRQDQERRTRSGHTVEQGRASHVERIFLCCTHCSLAEESSHHHAPS